MLVLSTLKQLAFKFFFLSVIIVMFSCLTLLPVKLLLAFKHLAKQQNIESNV